MCIILKNESKYKLEKKIHLHSSKIDNIWTYSPNMRAQIKPPDEMLANRSVSEYMVNTS